MTMLSTYLFVHVKPVMSVIYSSGLHVCIPSQTSNMYVYPVKRPTCMYTQSNVQHVCIPSQTSNINVNR